MLVRESSVCAPQRAHVQAVWELIDRWDIADGTALHLLGHGSGLTPHGKRSRFSLNADEAHRLANLLAIERLLRELLGEAAPWLQRPNRSSPFGGQKPIEFMVRNGQTGIDRTRHFLEREAFKKSV